MNGFSPKLSKTTFFLKQVLGNHLQLKLDPDPDLLVKKQDPDLAKKSGSAALVMCSRASVRISTRTWPCIYVRFWLCIHVHLVMYLHARDNVPTRE
jgi:hypothetical protein